MQESCGTAIGTQESLMRIPHYLVRSPSGAYRFRRRIPAVVARLFEKQAIKKPLLTRDVNLVYDLALALWRQIGALLNALRRLPRSSVPDEVTFYCQW